jgi:hypothetical protein
MHIVVFITRARYAGGKFTVLHRKPSICYLHIFAFRHMKRIGLSVLSELMCD